MKVLRAIPLMFNRPTTTMFGPLVPSTGTPRMSPSFNGWLYPQSQDTDSQDTSNFHIYQATLSDTDVGNVWLDGVKVMTDGTGANDGTNRKPAQISFGGDNRGNHTRSKSRIAEFFILNRVVPEAERLKIEGYLARKVGLNEYDVLRSPPLLTQLIPTSPPLPRVVRMPRSLSIGETTMAVRPRQLGYPCGNLWHPWYRRGFPPLTGLTTGHDLLLHRQGSDLSGHILGTSSDICTGQHRTQ